MREAVVILLPDVGGEQVVQRRDFPPPGQFQTDLEPFRVLAEHRIDDANEGLVAVEQPVPPVNKYPSSQPSHWCSLSIESSTCPWGARNSSFFTSRASHWRLVTSKTAPSKFESVSSGPKMRKLRSPGSA
jgi:hypothetical protein